MQAAHQNFRFDAGFQPQVHGWAVSEDSIFDNDHDTFGFDWGTVLGPAISTGVQIGAGWLQSLGQPSGSNCLKGQVSGDQAMTQCVPQVMAMFDQLQSQIGILAPEQVIAAANQIAGIFSDSKYFDQAIGGRSKTIREAAKVQARQRADAIIAAVSAQAAANAQAIQTGTAGTALTSAFGVDTQTILLGGGALFLMLMFLKS